MFYDEEAWQEFRGECLTYVKNWERSVVEKWLNQIGYKEPVGYFRNRLTMDMEIYTTRPGVLIGKAGATVKQFEKNVVRRVSW